MYINAIYDADLQNGEGVGVTLCVSGCPLKCQGCFNKEAQNPLFGQEYTQKQEKQILSLLNKEYIDHLAIIGGEPLTRDKVQDLAQLCMRVKQTWPQKKIWLWSGYLWEDIYYLAFNNSCHTLGIQKEWTWQEQKALRNILFNIDFLVDGPFIQEQKDVTLKWRGSKNQRVICCKDSIEYGLQYANLPPIPILYCD